MDIRTLGIDLAKNLFGVQGVDARGKTMCSASFAAASYCRHRAVGDSQGQKAPGSHPRGLGAVARAQAAQPQPVRALEWSRTYGRMIGAG